MYKSEIIKISTTFIDSIVDFIVEIKSYIYKQQVYEELSFNSKKNYKQYHISHIVDLR